MIALLGPLPFSIVLVAFIAACGWTTYHATDIEDRVCTGHANCDARRHNHGCYADFGLCDNPTEHSRNGI